MEVLINYKYACLLGLMKLKKFGLGRNIMVKGNAQRVFCINKHRSCCCVSFTSYIPSFLGLHDHKTV